MSSTNKIWIVFFSIVLAGFAIAFLMADPDKGIHPQDFKLKDIDKVVITNYPQEKEIILTDSVEFKPIIDQILKAQKTEIKNMRIGSIIYDIRIFYQNSSECTLIFKNSPTEGGWFGLKVTEYKNDALVSILNSFYR